MKSLFNTKEAAEYLGYTEAVLRNSRMRDGKLSGLEPPKHTKVGGTSIRYKLTDLDAWIEALGDD